MSLKCNTITKQASVLCVTNCTSERNKDPPLMNNNHLGTETKKYVFNMFINYKLYVH